MNQAAPAPGTSQPSVAAKLVRAILKTSIMWLAHFIAVVAWIAFMVKVVPFYKEYFEAHDLELPGITIMTLDVATAAAMYWYLLVLALIVFDGGLLLALQFLPQRWSWLRSIWFVGLLVGVLMQIGFCCVALDLPVAKFHETLAPK